MKHLATTFIAAAGLAGAIAAGEPARAPAAPQVPAAPAAPISPSAPSPGPGGPWLGIVLGDALDGGVQVLAVVPGGPADRGGVREGDVLLALGERATPNRAALHGVVRDLRPGEDVSVRLIREGRIALAALRPIDLGRRDNPLFELRPPEVRLTAREDGRQRIPFFGFETVAIPRDLRVHFGAPAEAGVLVVRVDGDGPAATAGVRVGDVLVRVANLPVEAPGDLGRAFARSVARPVAVEVVRARKRVALQIEQAGAAPAIRAAERDRLESERERLQRELEWVEAEIEQLRKLER